MLANDITSLQHPIVKHLVKLRTSRKYRYENKKILLVGIKQVIEAPLIEILLVKKGYPHHLKAKQQYLVTEEILKKITGVETPEPLAALVPLPEWVSLHNKKWIIALDGVSDPGNLGTLLRTALALGWEGAFLTNDCVDPFNDKALRSAKGATLRLPLHMGTQDELLTFAKKEGYSSWIADAGGKPLNTLKPAEKTLLILGNEAQGASPLLKNEFKQISIPIQGIESLNVAAAGAILMYTMKNG